MTTQVDVAQALIASQEAQRMLTGRCTPIDDTTPPGRKPGGQELADATVAMRNPKSVRAANGFLHFKPKLQSMNFDTAKS